MTRAKQFKNITLFIMIVCAMLVLSSCKTKQNQKESNQKNPPATPILETTPNNEMASKVEQILLDLKTATQLNFAPIEKTYFNWNSEGEKYIASQIVEGLGFTAEDVHDTQGIVDFFSEKRFDQDIFNTLADSEYNTTGFILPIIQEDQDNIIACLLTGGKENKNDPNTTQGIIQVQCGEILPSTIPSLPKGRQLKKYLANKYNASIDSISLQVDQETDNHVVGKFSIPNKFTKMHFLGTTYDDAWYLVYSGSSLPSCRIIRTYSFPEDMNIQCAEPLEPSAVDDTMSVSNSCDSSLGFVWCETKKKCIRPWKENCDAHDSKPTYTNSNEEKAIDLGKQFIIASNEYSQGASNNLHLAKVEQKMCSDCWTLVYSFDKQTEENKKKYITMIVDIDNWKKKSIETEAQTVSLLTTEECDEQNGNVVEGDDCGEEFNNIGEIINTEKQRSCCVPENN